MPYSKITLNYEWTSKFLRKQEISNKTKITEEPEISKEIQITNEHQILKEPQCSNETQITNKHQILKDGQIS